MKETPLLCLINGGYDLITDEFYMEKTYHFKVKTYHHPIRRHLVQFPEMLHPPFSGSGKKVASHFIVGTFTNQ